MTDPEWTDEQMRAWAADRIGGDPDGPIESWPNAAARELAELEAAEVELPSEAGARVAP